MEIKDDELLQQFKAKNQDKKWAIEYTLQDRKIFLTKLIIPDGESIEEEQTILFISAVLDNIRKRKYKAMPTSGQLKEFFRKHKQFTDLLPAGIRI